MLNLSLLSACRKTRRDLSRVRISDAVASTKDRLSVLAAAPVIGDATIIVDWWLFSLIAGLGIVAGISFGVIYRNLHGQLEEARALTTNTETELRTLLTVTDDAVLVLDGDGKIRAANPAAEELSGRVMDDLCGSELITVIPQRFVLADVTRQGPASFQAYAVGSGSANTAVELVLAAVELGAGRRYLALMRPNAGVPADGADLRETVARLCHNLNNQLTAVDGSLSMILIKGTADESTRGRVTDARRSMIKAQDVTRKLQMIAQGEVGESREPESQRPTIVPMPAPLPTPAPSPSIVRILVLDDEPAICTLVAGALEAMGFEVVAKETAVAAIQVFEEAFKGGRRFDLLISDLTLRGQLDGSKVAAQLQMIDPKLKAIISSGYDRDPVMRHYREHGFAGALCKPFDLAQLTRIVREVLAAVDPARKTA
jgi:CheY-like chemotaxis protein